MDGKGYLIEFDYNEGGKNKIIDIPLPPNLCDKLGIEGNIKFEIERICDWSKLLKHIYPDFKIEDCQGIGKGHPDFKLTNETEEFYVECKQNSDALRCNQMEWIFDNVKLGKKVKVLFFKSDEKHSNNEERTQGGN